ncbi:DUF4476 domain-containing protein [Flavobacterium sp. NKUCC04_CG]|uniref:DUF4476 domain-containing protein n=1 Tax=Flavobacterium sp. NKUCC04_CG TaxID=2842121 RepID=UPI001C5BF092|nr:DUF4476 domain-containing protein [Flavobacterium sp. NKUCC04_CG]MBW3518100.1 DUF4476 domain-containing protein [Flavobacterium sp. NKUCC04_CG]
MKKTFTLIAIFSAAILFAQEAGKKGELLKNEAGTKELQRTVSPSRNNSKDNSSGRTTPAENNSNRTVSRAPNRDREVTPRYNWNQNYGYAEVFLRIPEGGAFTVEIGNQSISNASGKFRFFDLNSGKMSISIYEDGYLLYRSQIQVRNDSRIVLDYFTNFGLYLLDSYPIKGQQYGFNQWDDVWNNPYDNGNWGSENSSSTPVMSNHSFENFLQNLKKNANFDKDKLAFIKQQSTLNLFTSQQIKSLLKTFSFDEQKVEAGKILYPRCADKTNFYVVYESFDFERGKRDLMNYIANMR